MFSFHRTARVRRSRESSLSLPMGSPGVETLEIRRVMSADQVLPVLLVIADSQDFYYQEYDHTRQGLESLGITVHVGAVTTNPSTAHPGTGQGWGDGIVVPDIALADVDVSNYSAIAFVGGWGSSMYQYAFPGDYWNNHYDGTPASRTLANNLINEFIAQDKYVAGVCHGTMALAWARVDGVSPLAGKQVSVPYIGSPAVVYNGGWFGNYELLQAPQAISNGAIPNAYSGQYGTLPGPEDDVVVDGKIITAENYDSAIAFGITIAQCLIAEAAEPEVPEEPEIPPNQAPSILGNAFSLAEDAANGTVVGLVSASDPDAGQTLSYAIVGGNDANLFAIDSVTGAITVANGAGLDFETAPIWNLTVEVTDSGSPALSAQAAVTVDLTDVYEPALPGVFRFADDLVVQGTGVGDTIYLWSGAGGTVFACLNGQQSGPHTLPTGGRVRVFGGDGNDRIYATDMYRGVEIFGEGGHDLITGGRADDLIDGGDGWDRIWGMQGNDIILGGAGNDVLDGNEGNDIVIGGDGNDQMGGSQGRDLLIGGLGSDQMNGGDDDDLLIGGRTSFDNDLPALDAIHAVWMQPTSLSVRRTQLQAGVGAISLNKGTTVHDDHEYDCLNGANGADLAFSFGLDFVYLPSQVDEVL